MCSSDLILVSPSGLITITGGKWTTYRRMAEDVVDQAERTAGLPHRACVTADLPIPPPDTAAPAEAPLHPALPITRAEVVHFARHEMARTVEDVLARRTRWLLLDPRASIAAAPAIAAALATELGRGDAWATEQTRTYTDLARGYVFSDPASIGV